MFRMSWKFFLLLSSSIVLVAGIFFTFFGGADEVHHTDAQGVLKETEFGVDENVEVSGLPSEQRVEDVPGGSHPDLLAVPFVVQAPRGKWSNPLFQDGCEEASVLIASRFGQKEPISDAETEREILALAELSVKLFGTAVDTSAQDTLELFRAYTGRTDGSLLDRVTGEVFRTALARNEILIVPVNGRLFGNPHFTAPGPETHMLVVFGYDGVTNEYITHDPGTRFGASYRYTARRLENAVRDYPTGNHRPITLIEKRAITIER